MKNNFQFNCNLPITELIKSFDHIKHFNFKVAIIVNSKKQVIGIITSGDLRRIIQDKTNLNKKISDVMNKSPLSINLHDEKLRKILNKIDDHLNIHPQKIDSF